MIAETYKALGAPVRLAVPPGDYRVLVRHAGRLARCELQVTGAAAVELDRCTSEAIVVATRKGGSREPVRAMHFELTGLAGGERQDAYTDTLRAFGYQRTGATSVGIAVTALRRFDRRLWLGGFAAHVGSPEWKLSTERDPLRFAWTTTTVGALGRAIQPFGSRGIWARSGIYAQLGAGLALGSTQMTDQDNKQRDQMFLGWAITMGGGLHVDGNRGIGFSLGYQFDYAPAIDNLVGDTHASGGHRMVAGVSYAY